MSKPARRSNRPKQQERSSTKELKNLLRSVNSAAHDDDVIGIARALYKGIGTPVSHRCLELLEAGDYQGLARVTVRPEDYQSVDDFYVDYCASSFLRKYASFSDGSDAEREIACKSVFYQAERDCLATNERFDLWHQGKFLPKPAVSRVIHRARELIKGAIGELPPLSRIPIRFGPGSTSNCTGEFATIADKLVAYPECTIDAVPIVSDLNRNSPSWFNHRRFLHPTCVYGVSTTTDDFGNEVVRRGFVAPKVVRGNRFTMVRKTALIFRGIGIEPGDNVIWQLGHGAVLSKRLSQIGLGKAYQAYENKKAARRASLDGEDATVDLTAASETVSYRLVEDLLPSNWFQRLASLRSPATYIDGKWVELEKFSSMGNGFTFELETLIFWALTRGTVEELNITSRVLVFGDDIIVRGEALDLLQDVFSFCGLTVNTRASPSTGLALTKAAVATSLGDTMFAHIFLKESPTNAIEWYGVVNGIARMGRKHMHCGSIDPRFLSAWLRAIARIPKPMRFEGPTAPHDMWIHTERPERWNCRVRDGVITNRGLAVVPIRRPLDRYCTGTQWRTAHLHPFRCGTRHLGGKIQRLRVTN
ncbi:MAG: RNA replicase beta chain [Sanya fiers-like virus 30]|nr:MAG: RNA replicase beta chain [Sanya fiers-like virus 30]